MESKIHPGITHTVTQKVEYNDTAAKYGSGLVEVFATPAMIALLEHASLESVLPYLEVGFSTVGFEVNVRHFKPTPVGMEVKCTATLSEVEGKKLTFNVVAHDEEGKIGEGTHIRYIIDSQKFMNNLIQKK